MNERVLHACGERYREAVGETLHTIALPGQHGRSPESVDSTFPAAAALLAFLLDFNTVDGLGIMVI